MLSVLRMAYWYCSRLSSIVHSMKVDAELQLASNHWPIGGLCYRISGYHMWDLLCMCGCVSFVTVDWMEYSSSIERAKHEWGTREEQEEEEEEDSLWQLMYANICPFFLISPNLYCAPRSEFQLASCHFCYFYSWNLHTLVSLWQCNQVHNGWYRRKM